MSDVHDGAEPEPGLDELDPLYIDVEEIEREERIAARRLSAIEAGRRKGGIDRPACAIES